MCIPDGGWVLEVEPVCPGDGGYGGRLAVHEGVGGDLGQILIRIRRETGST